MAELNVLSGMCTLEADRYYYIIDTLPFRLSEPPYVHPRRDREDVRVQVLFCVSRGYKYGEIIREEGSSALMNDAG